jgi:hypothetical protein
MERLDPYLSLIQSTNMDESFSSHGSALVSYFRRDVCPTSDNWTVIAFLSWYAFPPLLPLTIKKDVHLTQNEIANSNIIALTAT